MPVQAIDIQSAGTPIGAITSFGTIDIGTGLTAVLSGSKLTLTASGGGGGTVTSVGLALPAEFTVSGSPVTTSGTLTGAWANENANKFLAGPGSGAAATPGFRAIVPADMPVFVASGASHASGSVPDPGAVAGTTKFLREDATWDVPSASGGVTSLDSITGAVVLSAGNAISIADNTPVAGDIQIASPTFVASGASHAPGSVPDPGASAGTTKFLREDATWQVPAGGGGGSLPWTALAPSSVTPVVLSGFTAFNVPTGVTATQQSTDIVTLDWATTFAGSNYAVWDKAIPATPYTVLLGFNLFATTSVSYAQCGISFRDGTGKLVLFVMRMANNTYPPQLEVRYNTNTTTFSSDGYAAAGAFIMQPVMWMAVKDDGANLTFYWVADGTNLFQVTQLSRTAFLTTGPTNVGFCINNFTNSGIGRATLVHWSGA